MKRSDYEEKKERKKARLAERAARAEREGRAAYDSADRIAKAIPLGQPILVGHHSEKGHRADLKRIDRGMRKSIEKSKEADELRRRAEAVGTGGISSDDPEAVQKLQAKLEQLGRRQKWMKTVNAAWRSSGKPDQLRLDMARRWHWQPGAPFPSYSLSNLSAEVRRLRARIQELSQAASAPSRDIDLGPCRIVENVEENRVQLIFLGKPPEATRALLKQWGFRWSPMQGAWQRHLNDSGRLAARCVVDALRKEVPHGNP
jgi:hypothetical protein